MALAIVSGVTDALDGWVARRELKVSGRANRFGVSLDPVADKVFAVIVIVALIHTRDFPLWLAGVVFARDLLILLAGATLLRRRRAVTPSNLPGKYYFASLAVLIASYIADFAFGKRFFTAVTLIFWVWSSASYVSVLQRALRGVTHPAGYDSPTGRLLRRAFTYGVSIVTLYYFFISEKPYLHW